MKFENLVTYAINKGIEKEKINKVLKDMGGKFESEKIVKLKAKQKSKMKEIDISVQTKQSNKN